MDTDVEADADVRDVDHRLALPIIEKSGHPAPLPRVCPGDSNLKGAAGGGGRPPQH